MDTRELTRGSSDIVIAQVVTTKARWNESRTKIVTDVELRVSRRLKGPAGAGRMSRSEGPSEERLTLTQLGGDVDGVRYNVPGCPVFREGEEALLFVWRDSKGRAQVNGLAQGKFDILRDQATGEKLVARPLPGFGVADVRKLAPLGRGQPAPRLRLADMIAEIERALEPEAGR